MMTKKSNPKKSSPSRGPRRAGAVQAKQNADARKSEQDPVDLIIAQWRREKPRFDTGPMALFGALARAYLLTTPAIEGLLAKHGLARGMFDVLATLRRAGRPYRLAPSQLSKSLMLSGSGMTNRLDRLEALQLITRLPEPTDRRSIHIQLTAKGHELVEKLAPLLVHFLRNMVADFGEANVKKLTQLLMTFNSKLPERD